MMRAVLFDLYGTLTDPAIEAQRTRLDHELARHIGADPGAWIDAMRESFTNRATGRWGPPREILMRLCEHIGMTPAADVVDQAVRLRLAHHATLTQARADAIETLRAVRGLGLRTGLVSDCTPEIEHTWPASPLCPLFDVTVFSSTIGTRKPDAVMYRTALELLDVAPGEALYVGDGSSRELTGAAACGIRAVRITADHGMHLDEDVDWTGPTIHSLTELLALVSR